MLLSLRIGFNFVRGVVACTILEILSGFEPSFETIAPRYLNFVMVSGFFPFNLIITDHHNGKPPPSSLE